MDAKIITPKRLAAKWKLLPTRFEVNVCNFNILAGNAAVRVFKQSFYLQRFNSTGQPAWPSRVKNVPHPMLHETGSLMNSIKVKKRTPKNKIVIYTDDSEFIHSNRNETDPHRFGARKNKNRDYAFVYASIHNLGGMAAGASGSASFIKQRQFIGHSTVLEEKLNLISDKLFAGFPR